MNKPTAAQIEAAFQYEAHVRFERELAIANGEAEEVVWVLEDEEESTEVVQAQASPETDKLEQVYQALVENDEGGGMVYLDNISLKALNITERQFSGYCAALTKQGRYEPTSDKCFGRVIR